MELLLKRAYLPASPTDGYRVLVDRLWPRGLSKEEARLDEWNKDLAPSSELRRWFGHDPTRWATFSERYLAAGERCLPNLLEQSDARGAGDTHLCCTRRGALPSTCAEGLPRGAGDS